MKQPHLVLVGAGHAHVLVIKQLITKPLVGVSITLLSEAAYTPYSGRLPGLIAGHYHFDQVHINVVKLCRLAGIQFVQGRLTKLDAHAKQLLLEQQTPINYDWVSFDTGSTPNLRVPGAREWALGIKPVAHFFVQWQALLAASAVSSAQHWGVVGAGAGGIEMVLAMACRLRAQQRSVQLHLIHNGPSVLSGYPVRVVRVVEQALARYQVRCHANFKVVGVTQTDLLGREGQRLALNKVLFCTSATAPSWPSEAGLATVKGGFIEVNEYLQSVSHPEVFAAGDVAEMSFDPRPKAGVYAVRQAPFLFENLERITQGEALKPIKLQRAFLSLLSLGDKQAVGHKKNWVASGRWVWRLKDWIDQAFIKQFEG